MTITAHEKWKACERELDMRHRVYPKWVAAGKMTHREARYELDVMAEIVADYLRLADQEEQEERLL